MTLNTSSAHLSQSSNKLRLVESGSDFVLVSDFWFMFGSSACFYDNIRAMCALGPNPVWLSLTSMPWVRNVKWHFFSFVTWLSAITVYLFIINIFTIKLSLFAIIRRKLDKLQFVCLLKQVKFLTVTLTVLIDGDFISYTGKMFNGLFMGSVHVKFMNYFTLIYVNLFFSPLSIRNWPWSVQWCLCNLFDDNKA